MKAVGAALAVAALLATSACGGGGRPSEADVSKALQKGVVSSTDKSDKLKLTKKQADCTAKIFVKSELTDEALQKMANDHIYARNKKNDAVVTKLGTKLQACTS